MKKIIFAFLLAVLTVALLCVPSGAAWLSSEAPVLKYGSTGNYVTQLQQDLNTLGYGLSTDGSFGPATLNAVKDYQAQMGLEVDGSVGPATKSSIISTINSFESSTSIQIPGTAAITRGNTGIRVRFLQKMLCLLGYPVDIDGSFGGATYEAVRSFQSDYGITVDGSCGPETIRYINGAILGTYSPKPVQTEATTTTTPPVITTTAPVTTTTTAAAPIATTANSVSKAVDTLIPTIAVEDSNDDTTSPVKEPQISSGSALKYGSRGERVKELQRCLVYLGWSLDIDGSFGPSTKSAVMEFQRRCGLSVDGSCGPATTAKINEACAGGNVFSNDTEDSGSWGSNFEETTTAKTTAEAKKTTSEASAPRVKKIRIVRDSIGTLGDDIIPLGHSVKLTAKISPDNATTSVKWKTSNSKYLKVSSDGTVTGIKETPNGDAIASSVSNTVTITATADNGVKAVKTFRVVEYKPKSVEMKLGGTVVKDGGTFTLNIGDTAKIKSTLSPTYANPLLTWKVADSEIAEVKDNKIVAKKVGETTVTCKTANSKVKVKFTLKVEDKKWQWPVSLTIGGANKISGEFWQDRIDHMHAGIDIAVAKGTDVYASRAGTIAYVDWDSENLKARGTYIVIDHEDGYYSIYQHLETVDKNEGEWVNKGEKIGESGSSGYAGKKKRYYDPHLHFEVKRECEKGVRGDDVVSKIVNKTDNLANPSPLIRWEGEGMNFTKGDYLDDIFFDRIKYDELPKLLYNDYSKYRNYMNEPR